MSRFAATLVLTFACAAALGAHPEIEEALARIDALIAASPGDAGLLLRRGELYAQHEDWPAAEASYLRAAELAPRLPGLARARGAALLAWHQPEPARTQLDAALALDPADAEAFILRGRAQAALGRRTLALADFDAGLALIPTPSPGLFLERANLCADASAAVRGLDVALARLGPVLTLQVRALDLEVSLGRTYAALLRLNTIIAQSERKETWLKRRGDLLAHSGRTREARAAYEAALAAIATLPPWLRDSPDTVRLSAELARLTPAAS